MAPQIKRATRVGVRPLIGLYSESGCGKTYSALLLARGLVGPNGKIVMADSESGRGSIYADVLPGGYETMELVQPFSPASYIEAIDAIEAAKADVGIIDSGSHEWEGIGGVLDMAAEIEERSGKPGLHCWRKPKMEHAKFMLRMLQSSIPWIICLRAKYKSRQKKDAENKTIIVKDEATTPIQADDFIFEMTAHMEILQSHNVIVTKCSHPELRKCFPEDQKAPISIAHGELLAKWCSNPGASPKTENTGINALKKELWDLTKKIHGGNKANQSALEQFLWDEAIISDTEALAELTEKRLEEVIKLCRQKLK